MLVQLDQIAKLVSRLSTARGEALVAAFNPAFEEFEINTGPRIAMCMAQFAHETGGFQWFSELGDADYFTKYDFNSSLGNDQKGDGLKYKGEGPIQITGKYNYTKVGEALGLDLLNHPELMKDLIISSRASCWWWKSHHLNEIADINSLDSFKRITRVINPGLNGWTERARYWAIAKTVWV